MESVTPMVPNDASARYADSRSAVLDSDLPTGYLRFSQFDQSCELLHTAR